MIPSTVRLIDLSPESHRAVRWALEPLGCRVETASSADTSLGDTPEDRVEILVRERLEGSAPPPVSQLPTLWLVPPAGLVPQAAGEGAQDFLRLPAHRDEIARRVFSLSRLAELERQRRRQEKDMARQVEERRGLMKSIQPEPGARLSELLLTLDDALDETVDPLTERQRELIAQAKRMAQRLVERTEEMADAARAGAGLPITVRLDRVDLCPLLENLLEWSLPRLRAKGQELAVHVEPDSLAVYGDAERLTQAFRLLIEDAHRSSPPGTRIEIGAVKDPEAQGFALLSIADSGPGLPEGALRQLLAGTVRSSEEDSTATAIGMDLSLIRAIAEALGGEARGSNRSGGGRAIGLSLPLWNSRAARVAEAQALLASPAAAGSLWLCRATTPEQIGLLDVAPSLVVLSPGEILAICERPPAGVPRLGRVRDFRTAGSLARILQPRMKVERVDGPRRGGAAG